MYLSGCVYAPALAHPAIGLMFSPDIGNRTPIDKWWAFDNACFAHPGEFSFERYQYHLNRRLAQASEKCLFAVAPDVPFDADGTVARFGEYRQRMRALGVPVAFVTQDGMGAEDVPWRDIDALFVGGSTGWKLGHESAAIIATAQERGKWVHVGRVNSLRRLMAAASLGADSCDGTFLRFGPDVNWPRLRSWLDAQAMQPALGVIA